MDTANVNAEEAVLNMLQRYKVLKMEDLILGLPDFSWAQLFLAIDRLSRKNLITLHRMGMSYQLRPMDHEWTIGQEQQHEELVAHH
ncbi:MAG: hypothetical protein HY281_04945 [Nitrospirae bacterium]|nr:hypothetical protein [Nitrospirota bacterium]